MEKGNINYTFFYHSSFSLSLWRFWMVDTKFQNFFLLGMRIENKLKLSDIQEGLLLGYFVTQRNSRIALNHQFPPLQHILYNAIVTIVTFPIIHTTMENLKKEKNKCASWKLWRINVQTHPVSSLNGSVPG